MSNLSKSLRAIGRDLAAEKAATMFRKGHSAPEVCRAIGMSDTALRRLATQYGFRYPLGGSACWPAPDDPGEEGQLPSAYANWQRAVIGARMTLEGNS